MKDFDLEKEFAVTKHKPVTSPHPLKQFFADRLISQSMLAKVLDVTKVQISLWLNGCRHFPDKWLSELNEIKGRVLVWEDIHGCLFNSQAIIAQEKEVEELLLCPYDDEDIKFGLSYDVYLECAECDLYKECGLWAGAHQAECKQFKEIHHD